jgi:UDP-N-acetylmuramyl pentapeptide phosphotransferase/UDP-N-acetylglucosamine-1-phosphate transferase
MNMRPSKKLVAQLIASFVTIYFARVQFTTLFGLFGIGDIPYWPGIVLTTLFCTFFINVFNFVDGIDGLAGVLAALYLGFLGVMFASIGHQAIAGISFALFGATIGLLFYNISPARIYMGDTGSMFLGFTIFVFSLLFINWYGHPQANIIAPYPRNADESFVVKEAGSFTIPCIHGPLQAFLLIFSMLFLPIFDAIRVFILRASRGLSPLKADRTHLHYYLLDAGFTHTRSVMIIVGINILLMAAAFLLQDMSPYIVLLTITSICLAALYIIYALRNKHMKKTAR